MKKPLLLIVLITTLFSCADYSERLNTVQKKYPKCVVLPSLPYLNNRQEAHYEVIVKDTISKQMYGVAFYPFSETKISQIDLLLYYK